MALAQLAGDVYAAADAVIRPAVFGATRRLGWDLKPSKCRDTCPSPLLGSPPQRRTLTRHPSPSPAPVTAGLPFVDSPTGLVLCLAAYFAIVLLGLALQPRAGRAPAVKREDPLWLRLLVLGHNVFLVTLSLYMSVGCVPHALAVGGSCCPPPTPRSCAQACCAEDPCHCAGTDARSVPQGGPLRPGLWVQAVGSPLLAQGDGAGAGDPHILRVQDLRVHGHLHHAAQGQRAAGGGDPTSSPHRSHTHSDAHSHAHRCPCCTCTTTPPSASSGG